MELLFLGSHLSSLARTATGPLNILTDLWPVRNSMAHTLKTRALWAHSTLHPLHPHSNPKTTTKTQQLQQINTNTHKRLFSSITRQSRMTLKSTKFISNLQIIQALISYLAEIKPNLRSNSCPRKMSSPCCLQISTSVKSHQRGQSYMKATRQRTWPRYSARSITWMMRLRSSQRNNQLLRLDLCSPKQTKSLLRLDKMTD